jgi:hypothetical protein
MSEKTPALDSTLVHEVVLKAHGDLGRVQALIEQEPNLVNAAWDWGAGDWETPLGAAAHTGQRAIADYLLAHGARFDLFAAAMLGQLEIIKAVLAVHPEIKTAKGAHGIPLLVHAQMGGEAAAAVVAYLTSLLK